MADEESNSFGKRVKLRINDDKGSVVLELGAHVVRECPLFAAQIGELAAEWAHAEAEMGALLAALMDTAPERTFALMAVYRSASGTAEAARGLAKATLLGPQLKEMLSLISRFKELSDARNDVQHGLWALKGDDSTRLFRVKALEYTQFMVRFQHVDERITLAEDFAAKLNDAYTTERLAEISDRIRQIATEIFSVRAHWLQTKGLWSILNEHGFGRAI